MNCLKWTSSASSSPPLPPSLSLSQPPESRFPWTPKSANNQEVSICLQSTSLKTGMFNDIKCIAINHLQRLISSDDSKFNVLSSWLDDLWQSNYCQWQMTTNNKLGQYWNHTTVVTCRLFFFIVMILIVWLFHVCDLFSRIQKNPLMILKSTAQSFYETMTELQCYSTVNKVLQVCISYSTEASLHCHCPNVPVRQYCGPKWNFLFFYTDATKSQWKLHTYSRHSLKKYIHRETHTLSQCAQLCQPPKGLNFI